MDCNVGNLEIESLMTSFKTDRPNQFLDSIKQWIYLIGIILLILFLLSLYRSYLFNAFFKTYSAFIVFIPLIASLLKERVIEIFFNTETNQIHFYSKTVFSKPKQLSMPFSNAILETNHTKLIVKDALHTISFQTGKTEIAKLQIEKDGFSSAKLTEICQYAAELNMIVREI